MSQDDTDRRNGDEPADEAGATLRLAGDRGSAEVGIIGAGTMGAGIAQVAAMHGWTVHLMDVDEAIVRAAIAGIDRRFSRMVEKGLMTPAQWDAAARRLRPATDAGALARAELVIEAVVEDLDAKTAVIRGVLPALDDRAIIATNTSSLSVTELGAALGEARRTVGMHFFNPAPLLKLVEVVAGADTDPLVVDAVAEIARSWGKTVARAADEPGFIVNNVARPYYLEAFRLLEDGYAGALEIDQAMKTRAGFRMGPFELTDLIGQDVNTATTRSVWERLGRPPLLRPCPLQEGLVAAGALGRKTGRGVYDHTGDGPRPILETPRRPLDLAPPLAECVRAFAARAVEDPGSELEQYIVARILVALVAQAAFAAGRGVATPDDIDIALRYGVNYPEGPFAWARRIGAPACVELLAALDATVTDGRFAVPPWLSESCADDPAPPVRPSAT